MDENMTSSQRFEAALDGLENRIGHLVSLYEQVSARNRELASALDAAHREIDNNKLRINELEKQIANLQLVGAFTSSSRDEKEAKQKIGKLIKEIDRCIALLSD